MMMLFVFLCVVVLIQSASFTTPKKITKIPRYNGPITETIYSGYITTNEKNGRNLFYTFVLANENPKDKPLVVWLNGGPGCASGLGFISEHGPYNLYQNGSVLKFPYALNNFANVIYVDSPAGVGFSYNENITDFKLNLNDDRVAEDLYLFMQTFLTDVFPEYAESDLHIWGESYGGHYVPIFAYYIMEKQNRGDFGKLKLNLKAIAVNNGDYSYEHNMNGDIWWMFGHAVVSYNQFTKASTACDGNFWKNKEVDECGKWIAKLEAQMNGLLNLDLLSDCYMGVNGTFPGEVIECWNSQYLDDYFNEKEAYEDFYVAEDWFKYTKKWETCSVSVDKYYQHMKYVETIPQLIYLYQNGIRMLLMNGDVDDNCSNLSNQFTVKEVIGEIDEFPPWYYTYEDKPKQKQIGGFYQMKGDFIFATVRGAGHMVSTYQPYRSFVLYRKFFDGTFPK